MNSITDELRQPSTSLKFLDGQFLRRSKKGTLMNKPSAMLVSMQLPDLYRDLPNSKEASGAIGLMKRNQLRCNRDSKLSNSKTSSANNVICSDYHNLSHNKVARAPVKSMPMITSKASDHVGFLSERNFFTSSEDEARFGRRRSPREFDRPRHTVAEGDETKYYDSLDGFLASQQIIEQKPRVRDDTFRSARRSAGPTAQENSVAPRHVLPTPPSLSGKILKIPAAEIRTTTSENISTGDDKRCHRGAQTTTSALTIQPSPKFPEPQMAYDARSLNVRHVNRISCSSSAGLSSAVKDYLHMPAGAAHSGRCAKLQARHNEQDIFRLARTGSIKI